MSELLQRIKAAQLEARKSRDALTATLLTTVIGEAVMVGKSDGNRESTDAEVLQVLRKFEKGMNESIGYLQNTDNKEALAVVQAELEIIRKFMPTKISDAQVQQDIVEVVKRLNLPWEQKSMGAVVKELKSKYGEQFDGQQVSGQFKLLMVP